MLTCIPKGMFSTDFQVPEARDARVAILDARHETGIIQFDGVEYAVNKQERQNSAWNLCRGDQVVATAANPGVVAGRYQIKSEHGTWEMAAGFTGTSFEIRQRDSVVGKVALTGTFTKRGEIECAETMPLLEQLLAFWLLVMSRQRD